MKYTILSNSEMNGLIKAVNIMIEEGWRPQGGVSSIVFHISDVWFIQSLVKET